MTKHIITVFIACLLYCAAVRSQPVVFVNAGSRAPYGTQQELTIDAAGQCKYFLGQMNGPVKDSLFFTITTAQLDSFFAKATAVGFFALNSNYENGTDGSGVYVSLNHHGRKKRVYVANMEVPVVNELVNYLNQILIPHKIRLNYDQTSLPSKPKG